MSNFSINFPRNSVVALSFTFNIHNLEFKHIETYLNYADRTFKTFPLIKFYCRDVYKFI